MSKIWGFICALLLFGCGDSAFDDNSPYLVEIQIATLTNTSLGITGNNIPNGVKLDFSAQGIFSDNTQRDITNDVVFSSSNNKVITVNGSSIIASSQGTAVVTATAYDKDQITSNPITITVRQAELDSIQLSSSDTDVPEGVLVQLTAVGIYTDGTQQLLTSSVDTWNTESDLTINDGVIDTKDLEGSHTLSASFGGKTSNDIEFNVGDAEFSSFRLSFPASSEPDRFSDYSGVSTPLKATAVYTNGFEIDETIRITDWFISDTRYVGISNGRMHILNSETAEVEVEIFASYNERDSDNVIKVVVLPGELERIEIKVADDGQASVPVGLSLDLVAYGIYSDNTEALITESVTWSLDDSIASIKEGRLTGIATGPTEVTASMLDIESNKLPIEVTEAVLQEIRISPSFNEIPLGSELQLYATGYYSNGDEVNIISDVAWDSDNHDPNIYVIDENGLLELTTDNPNRIQNLYAHLDGIDSNKATYNIVSAVLEEVRLEVSKTTLPKGDSTEVVTIAVYSGENNEKIVSTTNTLYQKKENSGDGNFTYGEESQRAYIRATEEGQFDLYAIYETTESNSVPMEVTPRVIMELKITPDDTPVPLGVPITFYAEGLYLGDNDWTELDNQLDITWSLAPADSNFEISEDGVVTATDTGKVQVTATAKSGDVSITEEVEFTEAELVNVVLEAESNEIAEGRSTTLTAKGIYSNDETPVSLPSDIALNWNSLDPNILSVAGGNNFTASVTGIGEGLGNIQVEILDSDLKATISVRVTPRELEAINVYSDSNISHTTLIFSDEPDIDLKITGVYSNSDVETISPSLVSVGDVENGEIVIEGDTMTFKPSSYGNPNISVEYEGIIGSAELFILSGVCGHNPRLDIGLEPWSENGNEGGVEGGGINDAQSETNFDECIKVASSQVSEDGNVERWYANTPNSLMHDILKLNDAESWLYKSCSSVFSYCPEDISFRVFNHSSNPVAEYCDALAEINFAGKDDWRQVVFKSAFEITEEEGTHVTTKDLIWDWQLNAGVVNGTSISTRLNWPGNNTFGFRGEQWNVENAIYENLLMLTANPNGSFTFLRHVGNNDNHWGLCYSGEDQY
ncbi:Ig-like domain-containing protein [uncultured Vibrio sp.]|uniref:Ig-like domain-containing protein n=1 Tax=uncultured Vibrio sp. TaxID=114054 RepID=UPI00263167B1|nr:Ig-like domain-containing protein [uncultured Vibrio sp.]